MPTDSQAVACLLSRRSPYAGRRKQEKIAGLILISDYPEVPEESTDFCLSEFFIMHKYRRVCCGDYIIPKKEVIALFICKPQINQGFKT